MHIVSFYVHSFNPRPRKEATPNVQPSRRLSSVSIHAPVRRRLVRPASISAEIRFQSTPP